MTNSFLFDVVERDFQGPSGHSESAFAFLNRSARTTSVRVRRLLEIWFSGFPEYGRTDVRARFRAEDRRQHLGALFELYCHALIRAQAYDVDLHPSIPGGGTTKPDFLVRRGEDRLFYWECTLAAESNLNNAAEKRLTDLYEALDRLDSPNFFVGVQVSRAPETPPPGAKIRKFLSERLGALNPDDIERNLVDNGVDAAPCWTWTEGAWSVTFTAFPKKPDARGKPGIRPLGAFSRAPAFVDARTPIVAALDGKASRYGNLDLPFVVAVNALHEFTDEEEVVGALLGSLRVAFNRRTRESHALRGADGFWGDDESPKNRRVSASLVVPQLGDWGLAAADGMLWHHPWATRPLATDFWAGTQVVPNQTTGDPDTSTGRPLRDLLGLPKGWPRD